MGWTGGACGCVGGRARSESRQCCRGGLALRRHGVRVAVSDCGNNVGAADVVMLCCCVYVCCVDYGKRPDQGQGLWCCYFLSKVKIRPAVVEAAGSRVSAFRFRE